MNVQPTKYALFTLWLRRIPVNVHTSYTTFTWKQTARKSSAITERTQSDFISLSIFIKVMREVKTNPLRMVFKKGERKEGTKGGTKKDTESERINTERRKKMKAFYTNAEGTVQYCILHSVRYFPNELSFESLVYVDCNLLKNKIYCRQHKCRTSSSAAKVSFIGDNTQTECKRQEN
jgi:hypothetical protein